MGEEQFLVLMFTLIVFAGVTVLWLAMQSRSRLREMEHRERLAMIERGLLPAPETDPATFERRANLEPHRESPSAARWRSAGVMFMGLGLALMLLISFAAGESEIGIGIGGAFTVLGAAFLFNSVLMSRGNQMSDPYHYRPSTPPPRQPTSGEPPSNIAP